MNDIKISQKIKQQINKELKLVNSYFPSIPLQKIDDILQKNGYLLIQEDGTKYSGFLCGDSARAEFEIGKLDQISDDEFYTKIENSLLILTWYKMQSNNYEIVAYLS